MYLRVSRGQVDLAKHAEQPDLFAGVNAAVRRLPGYRSDQLGVDRSTGRALSVIAFDTLEQAQFSSAVLGEPYARSKAAGIWQGEPPEFFEVLE